MHFGDILTKYWQIYYSQFEISQPCKFSTHAVQNTHAVQKENVLILAGNLMSGINWSERSECAARVTLQTDCNAALFSSSSFMPYYF